MNNVLTWIAGRDIPKNDLARRFLRFMLVSLLSCIPWISILGFTYLIMEITDTTQHPKEGN